MESQKQPAGKANSLAILFFFIALVSIVYVPISLYAIAHSANIGDVSDEAYPFTSYNSDSPYYPWLADTLIKKGSLAINKAGVYELETDRTPIYPLFMVVVKLLTRSYLYTVYFQMIIVALTAFIIARIGTRIFSSSVGVAAGIFYILDPNTIVHTLSIMTDIVFVFLLVLFVDVLCMATKENNYRSLFLAGIIAGVAALTRPIGVYLSLLVGCIYAVMQMHKKKLMIISIEVILFLVGSGILIIPWMARNHRITGVWSLSSVGTECFFHYYIPQYLSFRDHEDINVIRTRMEAEAPELHSSDFWKLENIGVLKKINAQYLQNDFFGYGAFHIIKSLSFFVSSGSDLLISKIIFPDSPAFKVSAYNNISSNIMNGDIRTLMKELASQPITSLEYVFWTFIVALAFYSLLSPDKRQWSLMLWLIIIYFPLLTGPLSYARFRLPASPFIFLLAFEGLRMLKVKIDKKRAGKAAINQPAQTSL